MIAGPNGPVMTHEERLALIYRPFFITYMGKSYPWGGVLLGGYSIGEADCRGHRASTKTTYSEESGGVGHLFRKERGTGFEMHDERWFAPFGDEITKFAITEETTVEEG